MGKKKKRVREKGQGKSGAFCTFCFETERGGGKNRGRGKGRIKNWWERERGGGYPILVASLAGEGYVKCWGGERGMGIPGSKGRRWRRWEGGPGKKNKIMDTLCEGTGGLGGAVLGVGAI